LRQLSWGYDELKQELEAKTEETTDLKIKLEAADTLIVQLNLNQDAFKREIDEMKMQFKSKYSK
jgi:chromosome segregation ATPase